MRLLIATRNAGKAAEFSDLLAAVGRSFEDLSGYVGVPNVEETGRTFLANACLKAAGYAAATGQWALADDSGLEVDALGGKPGVVSARWAALHGESSPDAAGRHAGDEANTRLLLRQLHAVPDARRAARFVCVLALADPKGRIVVTTRGTMEGTLLRAPRGTNGFGYDPIFLVPFLDKTSAELTPAEKHRISHRGAAVRRLAGIDAWKQVVSSA